MMIANWENPLVSGLLVAGFQIWTQQTQDVEAMLSTMLKNIEPTCIQRIVSAEEELEIVMSYMSTFFLRI